MLLFEGTFMGFLWIFGWVSRMAAIGAALSRLALGVGHGTVAWACRQIWLSFVFHGFACREHIARRMMILGKAWSFIKESKEGRGLADSQP
jgi:hypothetical protein